MQTRLFPTARRFALAVLGLGLFLGAPAAPVVGGALAQDGAPLDEARLQAGIAVFKEGRCRGCHGWAGNGEREGPNPQGPSLRATQLSMEDLQLTVSCGRPGTEMPYYWKDAYKGTSTECYGVTKADLGDQLPNKSATRFKAEQLADLAYYLANYVKGRGEITFEECEVFFGAGDATCANYPKSTN